MTMIRTAVIDVSSAATANQVINIVEFDGTIPSEPLTGQLWVASDTARIGDGWSGSAIVPQAQPEPSLAQVQAGQIDTIKSACATAIATGFSSTALGSTNTYTLTSTDQINLQNAYLAAQQAMNGAGAWTAKTATTLYQVILVNGSYYICMQAGTTGASAPTWPTPFQVDVADGGAVWALAGWQLSTSVTDAQGNVTTTNLWHTPAQVVAVWTPYLNFIATARAKCTALIAAINAATTVAAALAVVWP